MPLKCAVPTGIEHQLTISTNDIRLPMPLRRLVITHAARIRHNSVAFSDERVVADEGGLSSATRAVEEFWGAEEFPHVMLVGS